MLLANNLDKHKCTGCKACQQICPVKCITMVKDQEGFEYPIKDESKCIECNLCKKVCPIINEIKPNKIVQEVYAMKSSDEDILFKSSSGGAFTAILESFKDENIVVFGVKFDEKFNVIHDYVTDKKDSYIFRKSKYVQSDIKENYIKVKNFLENGKKVIFTGTPCQIAGLRRFLNREYNELLLIDIICHGVPSQKVFNKYIEEIKNKYKKEIKKIVFREKTLKNKIYNSKNLKIEFTDGKKIIENSIENPYLRGYHNNLFSRPSCENCIFANSRRISDITIADCWGIDKKYKNMDVHKGVSMIVVNSIKGQKIIKNIKSNNELIELDLEFAVKNNGQFREPIKFNPSREEFFKNLDKIKFSKLVNKYVKKKRFRRLVSILLPNKLKKFLKNKIYLK